MTLQEEKDHLRTEARKKARLLSPEYRAAAGRAILDRVCSLPAYGRAEVLFVYVSVGNEPDTREIILRALRDGKRVCVPRCRRKPHMDAVEIHGLDALVPGALGIPEPEKTAPALAPESIGLALVPCVAASPDGGRLGHGAGYYDAFLRGLPCEKVCLCFEKLLCGQIPMGAQDQWMDRVISETGVFSSSGIRR